MSDGEYRRKEYPDKTERPGGKIIGDALPDHIRLEFFQYYGLTGRYDKAEDIFLYELSDCAYSGILTERKKKIYPVIKHELLHRHLPGDEVRKVPEK